MTFVVAQLISLSILISAGILLGSFCRLCLGNSAVTTNRLTHIEGLRALAALAVVCSHVNQQLMVNMGYTEMPLVGSHLGILGVQMFFGITAFLFTRRVLAGTLDFKNFLAARIRRLVPLYLFTCIFAIGILILLFRHDIRNPESLQNLFAQLFLLFSYGFTGGAQLQLHGHDILSFIATAWTLHFEWAFYIFMPFLTIVTRSRTGLLLGIIIFVIWCAHAYSTNMQVVWPYNYEIVMPYFISGIFAAYIEKYIPPLKRGIEYGLGIFALFLLVANLFVPDYFNFSHLVLATLLFLSIFLSNARMLQAKALQYLAQISYSIYLLQFLVLLPMMGVLRRAQAAYPQIIFTSKLFAGIFCLMTILVIMVMSHFTYKFIELPWMKAKPFKKSSQEIPMENINHGAFEPFLKE